MFFHEENPRHAISVGVRENRKEEEFRLNEDEYQLFIDFTDAIRQKASDLGGKVYSKK
ncbi:MAG: hypothetical protein AAB575_01750 [Patescibacteria group bacterium]